MKDDGMTDRRGDQKCIKILGQKLEKKIPLRERRRDCSEILMLK
jgi:hypothetical protein